MDREAKAMIARFKRDREFRAWGFWTTAQLQRVDPKKFPPLGEFLRLARGEKKAGQTEEEMLAAARRWHELANRKS
jgi:hypothetical protein